MKPILQESLGPMVMVVAVLATSGCGGGGRSAPTQPTPTQPTPAAPTPTTISVAVKTYLDSMLDIMQAYSINKETIDWANLRTEVLTAAGVAQTVGEAYPALDVALRLLNDDQSYYMARNGSRIGPAPVGGCGAAPPPPLRLPDTIGYVKIDSCDCQGGAATQFAESIQRAIRTADRAGLAGWVVDLRGNFGGNMWPMIAGIGPILGEGIVGWIVYNDREYEREYRDGQALSLGEAFAGVAAPYTLLKVYPTVAVLTDGVVASSGEAIVVFFRGRPSTRSFGTPTCGHHHLQQPFTLSDGATLFLATSQHADRMRRRYAASIAPDEIIVDPGEGVNRAIAWLHGEG
jgi:carboxyl-terminal processing protease